MIIPPGKDCQRCDLCRHRTKIVVPCGDPASPVAFVGEGPGENEDLQGVPFVGRAGKILDGILEEMGLPREKVFITNTVKCRPPENREPTPEEMQACRPYLVSELQGRKAIVGLGKSSIRDLLGYEGSMKDIVNTRQYIDVGGEKILFIPTYHPMACIYQPAAREQLRLTVAMVREEFF